MSSDVVDVVIIGGGLSGLSAGNYLFDHNIKNFLILEARDRVGGRTCTIDYKQHPVDVGGAYVGPFQNRILRLAREFNIRTYRINNKGKNILTFSKGQRSEYKGTVPTSMGVFSLLDLNYLLCRTQELCEQISNITPWSNEDLTSKYDHMTVEDWLKTLGETEEAKEVYRAAVRTIVCVEPDEVSMFAWLSYVNNGLGIMRLCEVENGAQERKFMGGSQQISNNLRQKMGSNRVLLNHVVKHIQWSSTTDLVQITCDNNKIFSSRHVIIALAPSLYKKIQFEPELPAKKREATERMYMGSIIKTITVFERPYWKEKGYSGSVLDTSHASSPVIFSYDDSSNEDQFYAIMGFIVADSSRKWAKQTREQRRQAICEQYARAFQCNDMITGCREYIEQDWSAEQFSGGCYTDIMPKDLLSSLREQLSAPCGDNGQLFFAGTELATRFSGYMDGAVQAGERAAFEVISKYLKTNDENLVLEWIDEEPVHDKEECRSSNINQLMFGPSKIEMLLPKASTVKSILKITTVGLIGFAAIFIKFDYTVVVLTCAFNATTPDETVPLSSLLTDNGSSPHTNGNTVSTTPADAATSFAWGSYLKTSDSHAAPVSYFHHAPLHDMWIQLTSGMKLEVINTDCINNSNDIKDKVFWFAYIVRVEGYIALLRYEGCEDDSSMDFWCNLCNKDVHCVGWCGQNGVKLAPPRSIEHRQTDWKTFLINKLVGAKTLPDNFRQKVQSSLRCPFKRNMMVEVIDKYRVSNMRVGKISEVIGGRLRINYENTSGEHFWVHHTSELIHPVGWSHVIGHEIEATDEYKTEAAKMVETKSYPSYVATADLFYKVKIPLTDDEKFKEGQKLEAVDPLEMSRICPATVGKVLKDGYFMLSIDGSSVEDGSDWFCYHSSSRLIFPINFSKINKISLSPPIGHRGEFHWDKYLLETNSVYAPQDLFQIIKEKTINPFSVGMKIEAVDMMAPHLVCVATVAQIADSLIRVHFDGWGEDFEQWIDCQSPNIYPIGWCELVGYKLEPPKQPEQENSESTKTRTKKTTNRKSNKRKRLT